MQELIIMVERKYPGATKTRWSRMNMPKFTVNFKQLQRLRRRRPELYESALQGLVDWIGKHAYDETPLMKKSRDSRANALEWQKGDWATNNEE